MSEEDQVELMSDLSSLLTSSSTCTCTNVPTVIPACTCTKSVPVIRAGTQHRAPCLVNLNEDPREGEYLSVDIPEVSTDIPEVRTDIPEVRTDIPEVRTDIFLTYCSF